MQIDFFSHIDDYPLQVEFETLSNSHAKRKRRSGVNRKKTTTNSYSSILSERSMIDQVFMGVNDD